MTGRVMSCDRVGDVVTGWVMSCDRAGDVMQQGR